MPTRKRTTRTTRRKPATRRRTTAVTKPRRRRRQTRSKGMLSELFNPKMAQAGGKAVVNGAVGGAVGYMVEKVAQNQTPTMRALITGGIGFIVATTMKAPNVGAGMGAVAMYKLMTDTNLLSQGGMKSHPYARNIESLPAVLNENGEELYLQQNDEMYLQEGEELYLQEDDLNYDVGYYGAGFGGQGYV